MLKRGARSERDACVALCCTINATGGVIHRPCDDRHRDTGEFTCAGDPGWTDLACAYLDACSALGHEPQIECSVPECRSCDRLRAGDWNGWNGVWVEG